MTAQQNWFQKNVALAGGYSFKGSKKVMTHDGYAWSGSLCFNGKKIGEVADGGFGGPLEFNIDPAFKAQVKKDSIAYVAATEGVKEDTFKYTSPEEFFLPYLADWQDNLKSMKTKCKNRVMIIDTPDTADGIYSMYAVGSVAKIDLIKAKNPTHFYLNDQF